MEHCDECGFQYDLAQASDAAAAILAGSTEFATILSGGDADVRTRRATTVWSPLEYGCHLRDMLLVQRERVLVARRRHRPSFDPMGRDERGDHDGYAHQEPANVARQLTMAAQLFANDLERLGPNDWGRSVLYNYPHRAERSLRWVAIHTIHEVRHHLLDVRRQLVAQHD